MGHRIFPARRLARSQHYHRLIVLNLKKRKVKKGLEGMPMEELSSKINLWGCLLMVQLDPAVYGLVSRRRS